MEMKTGPYMHRKADIQTKVFEGPDGGKRTFKILIAEAYNAGIIGTEKNGVAVLDEDNRQVVFDEAGINNPQAQRTLFERLATADWKTFSAMCRDQDRLRRGAAPDFEQSAPEYRYPMPESENWTVMEMTSEGPDDNPYVYSAAKRADIINELLKHAVHKESPYGDFYFAWNVKVYSFESNGLAYGEEIDRQFDERWMQYVTAHADEVWNEATENACSYYLPDRVTKLRSYYTTYPGADQGDYGFEFHGRSGGWLVLNYVEGLGKLSFKDQGDMEAKLLELDAAQLKKLYRVVTHLDHDITPQKVKEEMNYQYGLIRSHLEEEWKEEPEVANQSAKP